MYVYTLPVDWDDWKDMSSYKCHASSGVPIWDIASILIPDIFKVHTDSQST